MQENENEHKGKNHESKKRSATAENGDAREREAELSSWENSRQWGQGGGKAMKGMKEIKNKTRDEQKQIVVPQSGREMLQKQCGSGLLQPCATPSH